MLELSFNEGYIGQIESLAIVYPEMAGPSSLWPVSALRSNQLRFELLKNKGKT